MGAWIEIKKVILFGVAVIPSHPTMGAWIEISINTIKPYRYIGRTPRWVRGLKSITATAVCAIVLVAPHDGCVD